MEWVGQARPGTGAAAVARRAQDLNGTQRYAEAGDAPRAIARLGTDRQERRDLAGTGLHRKTAAAVDRLGKPWRSVDRQALGVGGNGSTRHSTAGIARIGEASSGQELTGR
jgi:hypothetical protein